MCSQLAICNDEMDKTDDAGKLLTEAGDLAKQLQDTALIRFILQLKTNLGRKNSGMLQKAKGEAGADINKAIFLVQSIQS